MSEPVRQAVYFSHDEIAFISHALNLLLAAAQKGVWRGEKQIEELNDRVFDIEGYWVEPVDKARERAFLVLTKGELNAESN